MPDIQWENVSIIIPAKNESGGLRLLIPRLKQALGEVEIVVVNDGSTDDTAAVCEAENIRLVNHPYSMGNGAAIKSGARNASRDILVFMDGDGQHTPEGIPSLVEKIQQGYDMAVGYRSKDGHASQARGLGNAIYNKLSSWVVGHEIKDLTSGMRAVKASLFRKYLYMLPNGFSYPTTITMAFFRSAHSVCYVPIMVDSRIGKSHLRIVRDGIKFFLIIFKVGVLYSPLKIFTPVSAMLLVTGLLNYAYSYAKFGAFTNMSTLMILASIVVFLFGLVAEQVTTLLYKEID